MVVIRPVTREDASEWLDLRNALWPDEGDAHGSEIEKFFAGALRMPLHVLVALENSRIVGFAELSIRAYAEGCETDRVAFLEG
jgi:aminoglycoside 6'-N-acetyltransferase I